MPQLLGLGVLWEQNDEKPAHTALPTRCRVLDHWNRSYSWEGGRYVALCVRILNLMMGMMLIRVDDALSSESNKVILQEGNVAGVRRI